VALFFAALAIFSRGDVTRFQHLPIAITASVVITLAIFSLIISILAIIGGIYTLRRKNWGMALAGSIAAFFCSCPLGIAAIILIVLSKNESE
jgi:ABC-type dipeptide/oligopeptide/nickel transport system permease component